MPHIIFDYMFGISIELDEQIRCLKKKKVCKKKIRNFWYPPSFVLFNMEKNKNIFFFSVL